MTTRFFWVPDFVHAGPRGAAGTPGRLCVLGRLLVVETLNDLHSMLLGREQVESQKIMKNKRKITISNCSTDIEPQKMHEKSFEKHSGDTFVTAKRPALKKKVQADDEHREPVLGRDGLRVLLLLRLPKPRNPRHLDTFEGGRVS